MMRSALIAGCLALLGCHEPFSNEDLLFLKSLPRDVEFDVPDQGDRDSSDRGLSPAQTMPAEVAKFYRDMVRTSTETNQTIFDVLTRVAALTSSAAAVRDDDRRAWGPIRPDPVEPPELLLVVDRIHTSTVIAYTSLSVPMATDTIYSYAFSGRRTSTTAWEQVLYGESIVLSATRDDATGYFCYDLDAARRLDRKQGGTGTYCASYDFTGDQQTVELSVQVAGKLYVIPDAAFSLHREADGSGRFFFSYRANVFGDPNVPEISSITVRWNETLAARADATVCSGDAPYELWAAECWDEQFMGSFLLSNIPGYQPYGTVDRCPAEFRELDALVQPCPED